MAGLQDHPIAERVRRKQPAPPPKLTLEQLKSMALVCGADDCGVASLDDPALSRELPHIRRAFPSARIAVSIVCRMHRALVRSPARSVANNEFHGVGREVDDVCAHSSAGSNPWGLRR